MAPYTRKNHPWQAVTGYETVDAFQVPSNPTTNLRFDPCYVPKGTVTAPLKFPNLVTGFHKTPIHAARVALSTRYCADRWFENQKLIQEEVSSSLKEAEDVGRKLADLAKQEKEKFINSVWNKEDDKTKKYFQEVEDCLKSKINELSATLKKVIGENRDLQEYKRRLQTCIQSIGAPLQICQECLHLRESRTNTELVNDKVEQLLMKEVEIFSQSEIKLENYIEACDKNLLEGRKLQNKLENFLKDVQWICVVNKYKEDMKRFYESSSCKEDSERLAEKSESFFINSKHLQKQTTSVINEVIKDVKAIWEETNTAFAERCAQMESAIVYLKESINKIKNEMFDTQKNLKCLKSNEEINGEVLKGEKLVASLSRTKQNLDSELMSKLNSFVIDKHKCVTMRRCYPMSIITNQSMPIKN